jgi:hypothetical protein
MMEAEGGQLLEAGKMLIKRPEGDNPWQEQARQGEQRAGRRQAGGRQEKAEAGK